MGHRIGEYVGPFTVIAYDSITKTVLVQNEAGGKYEKYSAAQTKLFIRADPEKKTPEVIVIDYMKQIHSSLSEYRTPANEIDVRLTEVIQSSDPRTRDLRMAKAIQDEARDLLRRGTFKVILKEEIPDGANVLTARYV